MCVCVYIHTNMCAMRNFAPICMPWIGQKRAHDLRLFICMYVCVYVCVHIHTYIHTYMDRKDESPLPAFVHMYVCSFIKVCMYVCV